jgi:lipopolysaccharide export system protein LptC
MKILSTRNINATIIATAVVVLLYFLLSYSETGSPPEFSSQPQVNQQAEFYISNTHITQYDQQGVLDATIVSEYIEQNPTTNSVDMTMPRVNVFHLGQPSWTITARTGVIIDNGDVVNLEHQVVAVSEDRLTLLKTPQLMVYPSKKTASTDRAVSLVNNNGVTRAQGLQVDLDSKQIELLSNVRGQYEPKAISEYVN